MLGLPAASVNVPAATFVVVAPWPDGVNIAVYTVEEEEAKLVKAPPLTTTSSDVKLTVASLDVNNKVIVELFENVRIEFKDEIFEGNYAIYTRDDNIIKLVGEVTIQSPTRVLTGYELIADINNNKRILNSANDDSLVEVLIDNNANN